MTLLEICKSVASLCLSLGALYGVVYALKVVLVDMPALREAQRRSKEREKLKHVCRRGL